MDKIILQCNNLRKIYKKKDHLHVACDDINLYIKQGECLGIVGESGSGKSTLANIIMNLEKADSGTVLLNNKDIAEFSLSPLFRIWENIVSQHAEILFPSGFSNTNLNNQIWKE